MVLKVAAAVVGSVLGFCSVVRAEQFVLVDVSYTHSADTTKDSHFYPELPADTPKNWEAPVDYAGGSVHILLDVKTKPAGDAPTRLQICFEATPAAGCTAQSPVYTKAGRVEWDSPFDGFWYESTVDWAQGIKESPLILKDDMNNKPAGDPKYMPTDLHVQVTLVSKGATFVSPPAAGSGGAGSGGGGAGGVSAGAGGAGAGSDAGKGGAAAGGTGDDAAGRNAPAAAGARANAVAGTAAAAGGATAKAGTGGAGRGAASSAQSADAGRSSAAGATSPGAAGAAAQEASGGCRAAGRSSEAGWLPFALLAFWATRRRARNARAT